MEIFKKNSQLNFSIPILSNTINAKRLFYQTTKVYASFFHYTKKLLGATETQLNNFNGKNTHRSWRRCLCTTSKGLPVCSKVAFSFKCSFDNSEHFTFPKNRNRFIGTDAVYKTRAINLSVIK